MQAPSAVPAVPCNATIPCNATKKRSNDSSSGANCLKKAKQQHAAVPSTCTAQQMAQMAASMGAMAASMGAMQLPMMPPMGMMGMMPPMPGMLPGMFFPPAMGMGMPFCPPFCSPFSFPAMAGAMAAASAPAPSAVDPAATSNSTQSTAVPPAVNGLGPFCGFAPMAMPQPQQATSVLAARTASGVSSPLFPSASCSNSVPAPPAESLPPRADSPGSVCNDRAERVEDDEFANFIDSFLKNDDAELPDTLFQASGAGGSNGAGEEGGLARSDSLLNLLGADLEQLPGF